MSDDQKLKLDHIRAQADALGVSYHHRAGVDKIQEAIEAHLESENTVREMPPVFQEEATERNPKLPSKKIVPLTEAEYLASVKAEAKKNVGALIHCIITCMNPEKRSWPGEIISVGSAKLGTFKKYIPFNGKPYHIPKIIYDVLLEKKCTVHNNSTDRRGETETKVSLINEFSIQVLPPLTKEELDDLRVKQAGRDR